MFQGKARIRRRRKEPMQHLPQGIKIMPSSQEGPGSTDTDHPTIRQPIAKPGPSTTLTISGQAIRVRSSDTNHPTIRQPQEKSGPSTTVTISETSESVGTPAVDGGWNESEVEEITSHLQDGRLVELSKPFLMQIQNCSDLTKKGGGFGKIYISRVPIPGFKHKLVIKAIGGDDENSKSQTQLLGSVKNEKLASRVKHFAIVPMLAYHDDLSIGKYYLISPYFENGDLFDALRSDNGDKVLLNWKTRLKVIYQISCAMDYMHTHNSFRGTILHLDIKSKNIVLDKKFNARLIDFGLSRESMTGSNVTTALLAGTELYRPTGVHKTSPLLDYYAFGVVIREILTGLGPEGKCRSQTPLALMDVGNFEDLIQRRIWTHDSVWKDMSSIASQCISSVDDDETSGRISSASIQTSLKSIVIKESIQKWTVLDDNNCEICIVNRQLETEHLSFRQVSEINHSNCATKIKICCACMRNSYINPVKCQECDNEIKSIIGDGWGAILIAGFDEDNDSFQNDVNMLAHAISSKVLPSMCVSTVITIDTATQTTEPVLARIDAAFKTIDRHHLHTLVFLYSGHHGKQGFKVGKNVYVSMQHINSNVQKCTHIKKVIVFMDCCEPEITRVNEKQRLIQFNATASTETAISLLNEASLFTKLLVQAFTMKASGGKCALRDCECCIDGPFITIDSLSHYIEIHRQNGLLRGMEPEKSLIKINWQNECLAYNYSYKVAFRFDIVLPTPFTSKHTYEVLSTTVNDYGALIQTVLFPKFADLLGEQLNVQQKSISHADKNADCLCIVYDTGPKNFEEVDNIEKLLLAWTSKRLLCYKLRNSLPSNCHKPSGFFLKNGKPVKDCMHEKKEFELTEMESFIKDLKDTKNACDTDTEQALTVFISNMSAFIHGCKANKLKHQRIQIRFIDLFEECTSCVVHLLLVDPGLRSQEIQDGTLRSTIKSEDTMFGDSPGSVSEEIVSPDPSQRSTLRDRADTPTPSKRKQKSTSKPGNSVTVAVNHFSLEEDSPAMENESIRHLFIEYKFLSIDPAETETPFSLPKPKPYHNIEFNFIKTYHVDFENNYQRRQYLASMLLPSDPDDGRIRFTLVSEPPEDDQDGNCEDVGVALVNVRDILKNRRDIVEEDIDIVDIDTEETVIGSMNLTVQCLAVLESIEKEMKIEGTY